MCSSYTTQKDKATLFFKDVLTNLDNLGSMKQSEVREKMEIKSLSKSHKFTNELDKALSRLESLQV